MLLTIDPISYTKIISHLLPKNHGPEQAAYLFAQYESAKDPLLKVKEYHLMSEIDFERQEEDYLELTDAARIHVIKKAHNLNSSLIEIHSHPGPWPAAFSRADFIGLREVVPHMQWRLPNRPYVALVVAKGNFDALVWMPNSRKPVSLVAH